MAKKWIGGMHMKKGAFTAQAKSAAMSVAGFGRKVLKKGSKASTKTKKRAVLARTFRGWARRKKG